MRCQRHIRKKSSVVGERARRERAFFSPCAATGRQSETSRRLPRGEMSRTGYGGAVNCDLGPSRHRRRRCHRRRRWLAFSRPSSGSLTSLFLVRTLPFDSPPPPPPLPMENQPAPTRVSKRIKLARAAREKLRPRSNETLAALPKSTFINSVVSALPLRDESFFSLGEGTNRHHGPVAKEVRRKMGVNEAGGNGRMSEGRKKSYNSLADRREKKKPRSTKKNQKTQTTARRRRSPPEALHGDQRRGRGASQGTR